MKRVVLLFASMAFLTVCAGQEQQDQIGPPPDGTSYTVVTSKELNKPDSTDCGFNDASAPNQGVFREELREYTEYKNGKVVRTWRETEDVFLRCYEP